LASVPEYAQRFSGVGSIYHPNEIAAELASMTFALGELFPKAAFSAQANQAAAKMFVAERQLFRRFYR
jgi:hypothetical protein